MNWLPWKRQAKKRPLPAILVVTSSYEAALEVAPFMEKAAVAPRFMAAADIKPEADIYPLPAGVLLLRELPTELKLDTCRAIRAHPGLATVPIAAVCSLLEGATELPADVVVRPPASIGEALRQLLVLVDQGAAASS